MQKNTKRLSKEVFLNICRIMRNIDKQCSQLSKYGLHTTEWFSENFSVHLEDILNKSFEENEVAMVYEFIYLQWDGIIRDENDKVVENIENDEQLWEFLNKK